MRSCAYYQSLAPQPADAWTRWLSADVPYAHVPMVALGTLAGVSMPVHRAIIAIAGATLGQDYWAEGVSLERLGVAGMSVEDIKRYVVDGIGSGRSGRDKP